MGIQRAASLVPFRSIHRSRTALCIALLVAATGVQATDGYFSHGYGMKAKGRGGASIAMTGDAFGGANNPATMAFAGDQIALGLDAFSPRREATRSGLGPGLDGTSKSGSNWFPVPEFAWNRMLTEELALGVTLYGNGGMNTDYPGSGFNCGQGESNMLCGMGSLGVDLTQLIVAPTVAYRITPSQSIGVSPPCWSTSSSRQPACTPSPARRAFPPRRTRSPTTGTTAPPAMACGSAITRPSVTPSRSASAMPARSG